MPFDRLVDDVAAEFVSLERARRAEHIAETTYKQRRQAIETWLRNKGALLVPERADERKREVLRRER